MFSDGMSTLLAVKGEKKNLFIEFLAVTRFGSLCLSENINFVVIDDNRVQALLCSWASSENSLNRG